MTSPERRLMLAIVERAILDAKSVIHRFYSQKVLPISWAYTPQRSNSAQRDLEALKHEIASDWFWEVCQYAGLHRDHVLKKIQSYEERAKEKYGKLKFAN